MPTLATLANFALGYSLKPEVRSGAKYQQPDRRLSYGDHPLQEIDFFSAGPGTRPLLIFLHGGAWQFGDKTRRKADRKAAFCREQGWHFASINFRMVPEVGVVDMAQDVARAIAALADEAGSLGVDRLRIVLMGHSSGAHLAALVGTDPRYLRKAGLWPDALLGVIANDGAAYDARERSTRSTWLERRLIEPAFPPGNREVLEMLSPAMHARTQCNAGSFLILHRESDHATQQAQALEVGLLAGGTAVERHGFAQRGISGHVGISRQFGTSGHAPTEIARKWLSRLLAS